MKGQEGKFPVSFMCKIFEVSSSGYYAWRKRDNSEREMMELSLVHKIEQIHHGSRETYGSPRVLRVLRGLGESCNKTKVERLMKKNGIRAKTKRKFRQTTDSKHNLPVVPNLLERNFSPEKANQVWASDLTYVWTREGWLFLAVIVDLFSRQIVGWSMDKTMTRELVLAALRQACFRRKPGTGLIFHSDRGSQYCSKDFRDALKQWHMLQSQSRKGDCWDNAVVESFFHTLKTEALFHEDFKTRAQAECFIFEWIEAFYNRERIHSTLGYMSPVEFEEKTCA
jgi:transposase InsO family protein